MQWDFETSALSYQSLLGQLVPNFEEEDASTGDRGILNPTVAVFNTGSAMVFP